MSKGSANRPIRDKIASSGRSKTRRVRKKRDAGLAQETILRVAREHFVSRGLSGGRIDEIAAASGYSKAMIYHYYGSKEALYRAVLEDAYSREITHRAAFDLVRHGPIAALEHFIREGAASLQRDPSILNLLAIENLHHAKHLEKSALPGTVYAALKRQLQDIIDEGVRLGIFRSDIEITTLYVLLSSIIFHAISNRYTLSVILETDIISNPFMSRYLDCAVDMVTRYCMKIPPEKAPKLSRDQIC